MSSSTLIRLGGIAAVTAGVMLIFGEIMYLVVGVGESIEGSAATLASPASVFQGLLFLIGGVLLVGAVISLYVPHATSAGSLGFAGFVISFVGTALAAGAFWDAAFVMPTLAAEAPELIESGPPALVNVGFTVSFVLFSLGWLLLGLAMLRSRCYPRPIAGLLMIGAVISFIPFPFTYIPFSLAVAWMGVVSLSPKRATFEESPRVA